MPFGKLTHVGPKNLVLDGGPYSRSPHPPREGALLREAFCGRIVRFLCMSVLRRRGRMSCPAYALTAARRDKIKRRCGLLPNNFGCFLVNVILTFTFAICYRPSVCRLSVVGLSVVCCLWRWCTLRRRLNFSAIFLPYDSPGTLLFWCQKSLVGGRPFLPEICVQSDRPPFKQRNFDQYRLIAPQP